MAEYLEPGAIAGADYPNPPPPSRWRARLSIAKCAVGAALLNVGLASGGVVLFAVALALVVGFFAGAGDFLGDFGAIVGPMMPSMPPPPDLSVLELSRETKLAAVRFIAWSTGALALGVPFLLVSRRSFLDCRDYWEKTDAPTVRGALSTIAAKLRAKGAKVRDDFKRSFEEKPTKSTVPGPIVVLEDDGPDDWDLAAARLLVRYDAIRASFAREVRDEWIESAAEVLRDAMHEGAPAALAAREAADAEVAP
jgi:hypothetical protein